MPEPRTAPAKTKTKRRWWVRVLRGLGWTFLLLVILHRPLILYGVPPLAAFFAKKQHLNVDFALSGSIFTNLTVTKLRVSPTGTGPTPVERINIERLHFDYNLLKLREGVGETLSNYEVHQADLAFVAVPSQTKEEREAKKSIAETLQNILGQPAAYSDRVEVADFNIRVRSAEAETALLGMNVLLDPVKPGWFRVDRIQIPGLPVWEKIDATTSYTNRNLYQRNLGLGPDIVIDELNFDASQRAQKRGKMGLKARVFGGDVSLLLTGAEQDTPGQHLARSYSTHLQIGIHGVRVRAAAEYFGVKDVPVERLGALELDFTGEPEKPPTWSGQVRLAVEQINAGGVSIPEFTAASQFDRGTATTKASTRLGQNTVQLDGKVGLPPVIDGWLDASGDFAAQIVAVDLPTLVASMNPAPKISGAAALDAKIAYRDRKAAVQANLQTKDIVFNDIVTSTVDAKIAATLPVRTDGASPLPDLEANIGLTAGSIKAGTFEIDGTGLELAVARGAATLKELAVKRGTNVVSVKGRAQLPEDPVRTDLISGEAEVLVKVPQLTEFGVVVGGQTLGGQIDTEARMRFNGPRVDGDVALTGGVALGEFRTHALGARVQLRGETVQLEQFTVALNEVDKLETKGRFETGAAQNYEGTLQIGIRDLAVLQPLLTVFGVKDKVEGGLDVHWTGQGSLADKQHGGAASVALQKAKYGEVQINEFKVAGDYTGESAKVELQAVAGPTRLGTRIVWAEERVSLQDLELRQGDQQALTGEVSYGLLGLGTAEFDPLKQVVQASLRANQLDIEKLLASLGQKAPAGGKITLHLAAQGTPLRPEVELKIEGRGLKAQAAAQFDAASLDVALRYVPGSLTLDASAQQPLIQPVVIKAQVPLDVEKLATDKKLDPNLPLDVTVKMPSTSLAFLPKVVPAVRRIAGTVALDVQARGTMNKPELSGAAVVALQEARLTAESVPAIGKFDAKLVFADDTLRFERFAGEIGGGTFGMNGRIGLAQLDDPTFDLQLKAREVLGMRNDSITVRADADIKVGGTLKAGTVGGTVFVTQSRFYKEIDILPIGLPGRPKPAPKSAPSEAVNISLPPPLDTWKFDIAIKTREDDPFLVRGNLANGRVQVNLLFGGTGAEPWLEGTVTVEQFTGSLPFSTITVENGHVYFTKNAPFQPTLDLQAQSKVRDYTVGAYVYGKATEPQLQLTSEPPLPHADIVSLLATGTTTSELAGNADVLASRAAMLAVQSLWRKVFKRKSAPPTEAKKGDDGFLDRFDLEFGAVDQKTGAREATARFKVNDQTYILGELDTQGRYTGSVKYLLRFR